MIIRTNGVDEKDDQARTAVLFGAYMDAQRGVQGAVKDVVNSHFKNKYADLTSVYEACKDSFHACGFGIIQSPGKMEGNLLSVTTTLVHISGSYIQDTFEMPVKDATNPQAVGSSLTYARRYALAAMTGVTPEDDDGQAAAKTKEVPIDLAEFSTQVAGVSGGNAKQTLTDMWTKVNIPTTPEDQKNQASALIKAKLASLKGTK